MKITEEPIEGVIQEVKPQELKVTKEGMKTKISGGFRRIFFKPKKEVAHIEGADIDESFFEDLPPAELKPSFFAKLTAPMKALFHEKKIIQETGLSTRQRIKRYNAMMEGSHGVQKPGNKGTAK